MGSKLEGSSATRPTTWPSPGRLNCGDLGGGLTLRARARDAPAGIFGGHKRGGGGVFRNRKKGALRKILDAFRMAAAVVLFMIGTLLWT